MNLNKNSKSVEFLKYFLLPPKYHISFFLVWLDNMINLPVLVVWLIVLARYYNFYMYPVWLFKFLLPVWLIISLMHVWLFIFHLIFSTWYDQKISVQFKRKPNQLISMCLSKEKCKSTQSIRGINDNFIYTSSKKSLSAMIGNLHRYPLNYGYLTSTP